MYENIINGLKRRIAGGDALLCVYQTDDFTRDSCINGSYVVCAGLLREFLGSLLEDQNDTDVEIWSIILLEFLYDDKCRREGIVPDKVSTDMLNEWIAEDSSIVLFELTNKDKGRKLGMKLDPELTTDKLYEQIAEASPLDKFCIDASKLFIESEITDWDKFFEGFFETIENEDYFYLFLGTATKDDDTKSFLAFRGTTERLGKILLEYIQSMLDMADDSVAKYLRGLIVEKVMTITSERNIVLDLSDIELINIDLTGD